MCSGHCHNTIILKQTFNYYFESEEPKIEFGGVQLKQRISSSL